MPIRGPDPTPIDIAAYVPIGIVPTDKAEYRAARAKVAALEKRLWEHMEDAGLDMLNHCPSCSTAHDVNTFELVRAELEPFLEL